MTHRSVFAASVPSVASVAWLAFAAPLLVALVSGCRSRDAAPDGAPKPQAQSTTRAASVPPQIALIPQVAPSVPLRVPPIVGPIKLDGELDEVDWKAAARTGPFTDATGGEARPFSEARFLRDDENLYIALYAADDDIHSTVKAHDGPVWIDDSFSLRISAEGAAFPIYMLDISAGGIVTDVRRDARGVDDASWESGITLGVDQDGTPNDPKDEDEEWVIEAKLPLKSMNLKTTPGTRFAIAISRCDTPRAGGPRRCGSFGDAPHDRMAGGPKAPAPKGVVPSRLVELVAAAAHAP